MCLSGFNYSEKAPASTSLFGTGRTLLLCRTSGPSLQLAETLDLLQRELKHLFLLDHVEVSPDPRILSRKSLDFRIRETPAQSLIQLAGKVVVELGQQLDIEEENGRGRELVRDHIQENFRTIVLVLQGGTLFRADGVEPHLDEFGSIAEEDTLTA